MTGIKKKKNEIKSKLDESEKDLKMNRQGLIYNLEEWVAPLYFFFLFPFFTFFYEHINFPTAM